MKIGIESGAYVKRYGLEDGLRRMRSHGYECLDYQFFADTEGPLFQLNGASFEKELLRQCKLIEDNGIEISQTHGPWRWPPRDYSPEDRAERFEKMCAALEGTAAVGAPCMAIHNIMPFGVDTPPDPARFMDMNREFFSRLLEKAKAAGVVIALENMPFKKLPLSTPEQVLNFVKEFDSPFFRVCLDTGHAAVFGLSPADAVRQIGKEYLACLHVHDNDGAHDLHWLPYRGVIDWEEFSRALHEAGFDGSLSLETNVSGKIPSDIRLEWEKALAATARHLANLPALAR